MKKILVICDMFGVMAEEIAPYLLANHCDAETAQTLRQKYFPPADKGEISLQQLFDNLAKDMSLTSEQVANEWYSLIKPKRDVAQVVQNVRNFADTALLSNAPKNFVEQILPKLGYSALFDKVVVSSAVGMVKPSQEIFSYCIGLFGKKYDKILMIDDTIANLANLPQMGIIGLHYTTTQQLINDLQQHGVLPQE